MTSFIPIFAILMLVMMTHSTDSGAVSKSNPRQNVETRKSSSFAKSKTKRSKKDTFSAKNYQKSAERDEKDKERDEQRRRDRKERKDDSGRVVRGESFKILNFFIL